MRSSASLRFAAAFLLVVGFTGVLTAQALTVPPGGANQRAVVTQYLGLVSVTIDYNAPDVTSPAGEDRTGKIWGQLVPWGIAPNPFYPGFGSAEEMPWRAGSNEATKITFSRMWENRTCHVKSLDFAAARLSLRSRYLWF